VELGDLREYIDRVTVGVAGSSAVTDEDELVIRQDPARALSLLDRMAGNTMRYLTLCYDTIDRLLPIHNIIIDALDPIDVLQQRNTVARESSETQQSQSSQSQTPQPQQQPPHAHNLAMGGPQRTGQAPAEAAALQPPPPVVVPVADLPRILTRRYELYIVPEPKQAELPLRQVRAAQIGKLVRVRGIVTRVTEVKPMLQVATYSCDQCGLEAYQEITSRQFMPLLQCPSAKCKANRQPGKLLLQTRGSKFVKFQELKIQEVSSQVPIGHIPRTMTCHALGELTRRCTPGDTVSVAAVFLPVPNVGFKAVRTGQLVADTYMLAMSVDQHKKKYVDLEPSPVLQAQLDDLVSRRDRTAYERLAKSIAPEIFGLEDVKKALLLQMIGGVTRTLEDGMKIRGDINVLLMGDPGVAKSQLLKHISTVAPRAVYTSGKGSSGVGLTAAVLRDPNTKEFVLEGGSLVMADMGICCIDEFDKMEESDRTAIHEVMEQQTISIAKAGITTTLNARAAILAAANPAWGRYNTKRSPSENINLPASLLSRFDILFLLLDEPDSTRDRELAQHITFVHRFNRHPELGFEPYEAEFLRGFVAIARRVDPTIPRSLMQYIVSAYVGMRNQQAAYGTDLSATDDYSYTTPRTLLAILRLSQALARLRFDVEVSQADVEEAIRLMDKSKQSLHDSRQRKTAVDPVSAIYHIIRDAALSRADHTIGFEQILPQVILKGFNEQQLNDALGEYEQLGVFAISANRRLITVSTG
jgi:DNA replication licensing factor MCM7